MVGRKPDADRIARVLRDLGEQDWVKRTERRWWPYCVFHYTDIRNAVQILSDGYIYSRERAEQNGKLRISSGSTSVLSGTRADVKKYVRLYFRPKTPTQYYAEGIYSRDALSQSRFSDAHCPVPVFFLFDSASILGREDCRFSDGNLGSPSARKLSTAVELEQLPWGRIYHTGSFHPSTPEGRDIVFRRNAEVIVPDRLGLEGLRRVYCRSNAERETLLSLLPPELQCQYQSMIMSTTRSILYYRRQTFIEEARLSSDGAVFSFSPETQSPGPFHLKVDLVTERGSQSRELESFSLTDDFRLRLAFRASFYSISVSLDGNLAYSNSYEEFEIPF